MSKINLQLRRDTTTNWTSKNPILKVGEPGYDTKTGELRIGNGTDHYLDLPNIASDLNNSGQDSQLITRLENDIKIALNKSGKNDNVVQFDYPNKRWTATRKQPITTPINYDLTGAENMSVCGAYYKAATLSVNDPENRILSVNQEAFVANEICMVWFTVDIESGGVHINVQGGFTVNTPDKLPNPINKNPYITLIGDYNYQIPINGTYTDQGATAFDMEDGDITNNLVVTNDLNTSIPGTYTYTYNVTDGNGLKSETIIRTVIVGNSSIVPNTPPVITLVGDSVVEVIQGQSYTDQGATALDSHDGNITSSIQINNTVNHNIVGQYIITYNVKSSQDISAIQIVRTVNVVKAPPTQIQDLTIHDNN